MSVRLTFDGMPAFRDALRRMPEELSHEANAIVHEHANAAGREIESGYPEGPTGNLKRGVTTRVEHSRFGGSALVRSRAPHASIFEKGTAVRRNGAGANRGRMPQPPVQQRMIPKAVAHRKRMVDDLKAMLTRNGLLVED